MWDFRRSQDSTNTCGTSFGNLNEDTLILIRDHGWERRCFLESRGEDKWLASNSHAERLSIHISSSRKIAAILAVRMERGHRIVNIGSVADLHTIAAQD